MNTIIRVGSIIIALAVLINVVGTVYSAVSKSTDAFVRVLFFFSFYGFVQLVTLVFSCCMKRLSAQELIIIGSLADAFMFCEVCFGSFITKEHQLEVYFLVIVGLWGLVTLPLFFGERSCHNFEVKNFMKKYLITQTINKKIYIASISEDAIIRRQEFS